MVNPGDWEALGEGDKDEFANDEPAPSYNSLVQEARAKHEANELTEALDLYKQANAVEDTATSRKSIAALEKQIEAQAKGQAADN